MPAPRLTPIRDTLPPLSETSFESFLASRTIRWPRIIYRTEGRARFLISVAFALSHTAGKLEPIEGDMPMLKKQKSLRFVPRIVTSLVFAVWLLASTFAQQKSAGMPLNAAEVERWADDVFGKLLGEHRFSALAIAVTQGDQSAAAVAVVRRSAHCRNARIRPRTRHRLRLLQFLHLNAWNDGGRHHGPDP